MPWLAALVVWNLTFDYQVRRAGEAFVTQQLTDWQQGRPPRLIRDVFRPEVARAAVVATGAAGLVASAGLVHARRRARGEHNDSTLGR
jgi:hypothetical protein